MDSHIKPQMAGIILAGAGQIGSRHLQGLKHLPFDAQVWLVDPSDDNLSIAVLRANEIEESTNILKIRCANTIHEIDTEEADLAIIATNSDVRPLVVSSVADKVKLRYMLLEKVVYQSSAIFKEQLKLLNEKGILSWVNCPRRVYPFYKQLKDNIDGEDFVSVKVSGSCWNLGCNAIHFIDLFAYLTGNNKIRLKNANLDREIISSKRQGFREFTGTLNYCSDAGNLELVALPGSYQPPEIEINVSGNTWKISEINGTVTRIGKDGTSAEVSSFRFPYQSELTGYIAGKIINSGKCDLTSLEESFIYHSLLFEPFLNHIKEVEGVMPVNCPIT